jgi:metallo-beta-lactamase family protein
LESTYGNRLHHNETPERDLAAVVNASVDRGGVLVIPSFAVGRTQQLLYTLRELEEDKEIPSLPVYVDSPMAIDTTTVFEKNKGYYGLVAKVLEIRGTSILKPQQISFCRHQDQSKALNQIKKNAIIISASGMATGGRILHHMRHRLPRRQDTMLFIGYQAEGTRGRAILNGNSTVRIHGEDVPIKAQVENISGFSAHADYNEILAWLIGFNRPPKKTFIVHGEPDASASLTEKITDKLGWNVVVPKFEESFTLD